MHLDFNITLLSNLLLLHILMLYNSMTCHSLIKLINNFSFYFTLYTRLIILTDFTFRRAILAHLCGKVKKSSYLFISLVIFTILANSDTLIIIYLITSLTSCAIRSILACTASHWTPKTPFYYILSFWFNIE